MMTERKERIKEGYRTGELTPFIIGVDRKDLLGVVDLLLSCAFEITIGRSSKTTALDSVDRGAYVIVGGVRTEDLPRLKTISTRLRSGHNSA